MRIYALDVLRFLAASFVVLYHYTATPTSNFESLSVITQYGYIGVPLFFMISGFVIFASAYNRNAIDFAISRFVRLYPMYWCGVILTTIVIVYFGDADNRITIVSFFANMTMLNDYLNIKNIDDVYWTLQVELKFYACIFILLAFKVFNYYKVWLTAWMLLLISYFLTDEPTFLGWFISPTYSSFFILGITLFLIYRDKFNRFNVSMFIASLILSSIYSYKQTLQFIYNAGLLHQYISVVILWCVVAVFLLVSTKAIVIKPRKYIATLGALTYPLYLFHNMIGKLIFEHNTSTASDGYWIVFVIIAMLILSFVFHRLIDGKISKAIKIKLTTLSIWLKNNTFRYKRS